jgi:transposase-like protein
MKEPKTLQEAIVYFSDPERAFVFAVNLCFPDGKVICPRCGGKEHRFVKTRRIWLCKACQKQFSLKVGTIFEDSPIGLDKWMTAFWMLCNCKNGISSMEIHRTLGITQKSAWFMLQRLRLAMQDSFYTTKLGGGGEGVEVDETFIGGKARNMHKSRRQRMTTIGKITAKAAVMGMLERGGKVRATVLGQRVGKRMQEIVRKNKVF